MQRTDNPDHRAADLVVIGARQLVLCDPTRSDGIGLVDQGCLAVRDGLILAIGTEADILSLKRPETRVIDAAGGTVTPGLVDCHTHLIFQGDRAEEYFARAGGLDDAGLTEAGLAWGVPASQRINAGVSVQDLVSSALPRARRMLACGTTTIETKSGYGLDHDSDIASLEAARAVAEMTGLEIMGTYLGAHSRPAQGVERYLEHMIAETIPRVAETGLAQFCDVYADPAVYTLTECTRVLRAAADQGMGLKLHTDARVNIGGARLAAEMGAVSVDHCNMLSDDDLRLLADAGTTVAIFPGFDWAVGHSHPVDGRRMIESGVTLAVSTDLCPVCWHLSQQMSAGFAARLSGLSPEQAFLGVTLNAARALRRDHLIGSLAPAKQADIAIFDVPDFRQILFRFGTNSASWVLKKGRVLVESTVEHATEQHFDRQGSTL